MSHSAIIEIVWNQYRRKDRFSEIYSVPIRGYEQQETIFFAFIGSSLLSFVSFSYCEKPTIAGISVKSDTKGGECHHFHT